MDYLAGKYVTAKLRRSLNSKLGYLDSRFNLGGNEVTKQLHMKKWKDQRNALIRLNWGHTDFKGTDDGQEDGRLVRRFEHFCGW